MKAVEAKLLSLLQKSPQFIIPIYQRTYSWTEKECRQLWNDILRVGQNDKVAVHFVGSIVYIEQGLSAVTHQAPLLVIDGQQRLTTVTLLIEALARALGEAEPLEGFSATKLRSYYLSNPFEREDRFFKLLLSQTDNDSLKAVIRNSEAPKEESLRVASNFAFFTELIAGQKGDLVPICRGLAKLVVVDIALSREQDNPQLIFESMNSTGKQLSQADLIRNFVLMGLEPGLQTKLYEKYWRPMELDFGQEAYGTQFDSYMRYYLTVRTGNIPRESDVYEVFKKYSRTNEVVAAGTEALVADIRAYAHYFCAIALGGEKDATLSRAFHDLRELRVDVPYPFLLELYNDYTKGLLKASDFSEAVQIVESYVFRRAVCRIPGNSMHRTFANFRKSLLKDRYLESVKAHFLRLPSYRRFPSDEEFRRELLTCDLYNFRSRSYWLRRLENHDRKERVPVDEYTIEHIMPQNRNLSEEWQKALGDDWQRVQEELLHTIGNLTLTGYNSEYSDLPFAEKCEMKGGFKMSPLKLNEGLGQQPNEDLGQPPTWNRKTIEDRAKKLADQALTVWRAPELDPGVLATYQPAREPAGGGYTIKDHPHLLAGAKYLFEAFRKEVLALDSCVTEEFLKLYVAYKAETNFVDVVPMASRLKLNLNMEYPDLVDPRGICRDVTSMKRWGNGDVEVELKSIEDLPYIMGIVRQSLELQLGNGSQS